MALFVAVDPLPHLDASSCEHRTAASTSSRPQRRANARPATEDGSPSSGRRSAVRAVGCRSAGSVILDDAVVAWSSLHGAEAVGDLGLSHEARPDASGDPGAPSGSFQPTASGVPSSPCRSSMRISRGRPGRGRCSSARPAHCPAARRGPPSIRRRTRPNIAEVGVSRSATSTTTSTATSGTPRWSSAAIRTSVAGRRGAGPPQFNVRGLDRDGDRAGRGRSVGASVDRSAALHLVKHGGDDVRDAGGSRRSPAARSSAGSTMPITGHRRVWLDSRRRRRTAWSSSCVGRPTSIEAACAGAKADRRRSSLGPSGGGSGVP